MSVAIDPRIATSIMSRTGEEASTSRATHGEVPPHDGAKLVLEPKWVILDDGAPRAAFCAPCRREPAQERIGDGWLEVDEDAFDEEEGREGGGEGRAVCRGGRDGDEVGAEAREYPKRSVGGWRATAAPRRPVSVHHDRRAKQQRLASSLGGRANEGPWAGGCLGAARSRAGATRSPMVV